MGEGVGDDTCGEGCGREKGGGHEQDASSGEADEDSEEEDSESVDAESDDVPRTARWITRTGAKT